LPSKIGSHKEENLIKDQTEIQLKVAEKKQFLSFTTLSAFQKARLKITFFSLMNISSK